MPKNVKCRNCLNLTHHWCDKVIDSPDEDMERDCQYFYHKTNADRIRAMSDEGLAELIVKHKPLYSWPKAVREIWTQRNVTKVQAWVTWLQQPSEGE